MLGDVGVLDENFAAILQLWEQDVSAPLLAL
jgi:hypothetical protein